MYITEVLNSKSVADRLIIAKWLNETDNHFKLLLAVGRGLASRLNTWYFLKNYTFNLDDFKFYCVLPNRGREGLITIPFILSRGVSADFPYKHIEWNEGVASWVIPVFRNIITNGVIYNNEKDQIDNTPEEYLGDLSFEKFKTTYLSARSSLLYAAKQDMLTKVQE